MEYFEELIVPNDGKKVEISCWGLLTGDSSLKEQKSISRKEVKKAIGKLKIGKAPAVDGIRAEVLKYGMEAVVNMLVRLCQVAWTVSSCVEDR